MTTWLPENLDIEPERYELFENRDAWDVTRRDFFRIVGGGVVVALLLGDAAVAQRPRPRRPRRRARPQEIGAWLHIGEDGAVTVYTGKVEIGQNIRTSLTQVVAEELRLPVESDHDGDGRHGPRARSTAARSAARRRRRWRRNSAGSPPRPASC